MSYVFEHLHIWEWLSLAFTHKWYQSRVQNSWIIIFCSQYSLLLQYLLALNIYRQEVINGFAFPPRMLELLCVNFKTFFRICLWIGQNWSEYILLVERNILGVVNRKDSVMAPKSGTLYRSVRCGEIDMGWGERSLNSHAYKYRMSEEDRESLTKERFWEGRTANPSSWLSDNGAHTSWEWHFNEENPTCKLNTLDE